MNAKLILAGFIGLSALVSPVALAQAKGTSPAAVQAAPGKVAQALAEAKYVNDKRPYAGAKYYFYLFSASWCGPCQALKPQIVAQYAEMKKSGVAELILIGNDRDDVSGKAYAEHYGCPSVMMANARTLPGIASPRGIPFCAIVDADGKLVTSGHGSMAIEWKDVINQYESQQGIPTSFTPEAAAAAEAAMNATAADDAELDDEDEADEDKPKKKKKSKKAKKDKKEKKGKYASKIGPEIAKLKFLNKNKPSAKAKAYVYLYSASWCGPCKALAPQVVAAYKKMKRDNVELILISQDRDEASGKAYAEHYDNPAVMYAEAEKKLPGFQQVQGIPHAVIVNGEGEVVRQGHGSIALQYKEILKDALSADDDDAADEEDEEEAEDKPKKKKKSKKAKKSKK